MPADSVRTIGFFDLTDLGARSAPGASGDSDRTHLQRRIDLIARDVCASGGRVIKQIGDELMCAFDAPVTAVTLAMDLARRLDTQVGDGRIVALRVGLHHGSVVEEAGDLFGDTVNVAARITSIATPGQILITEPVREGLAPEHREATRLFDELRVRGTTQQRSLYRVLWSERSETEGHTQMPRFRAREQGGVLVLHHQDAEIELRAGAEEVRLGRDARCEFRVRSDKASRFHAVVSVSDGQFLLRDQSTNGTWVRMQGSPVVTLRRETLPLLGEGIISLGEAVGGNAEHLIRFTST